MKNLWVVGSLAVAALAMVGVGCGGDEETTFDPTGGPGTSTSQGGAGGSGGDGTGGDAGAGGGTGGAGGEGGGTSACVGYCEYLDSLEICDSEPGSCVASCEEQEGVAPWCDPLADAYYACMIQEPASNFSCVEGFVEHVGDACNAERSASQSCMFQGPPEGLPDMTADCQALCNGAAGLPCAPDDCVQSCLDGITASAGCRGAMAIHVHCLAREPAEAFECSGGATPQVTSAECAAGLSTYQFCISNLP
ncbi:hypothetical protein [Chondromyces crocatus]|nr:hypothetical protein [Chondromyces crocatus]